MALDLDPVFDTLEKIPGWVSLIFTVFILLTIAIHFGR